MILFLFLFILLLYQLRVYTNAWIPSLHVLFSIKEKSVKITDGTKEEDFLKVVEFHLKIIST